MGHSLGGQSQIEMLAGDDREKLTEINKNKLPDSDSLRNEITAKCAVTISLKCFGSEGLKMVNVWQLWWDSRGDLGTTEQCAYHL